MATITLDWRNWAYGIGAGFIGGGANAVVGGVVINLVDAKDFNIYTLKFYVMVGMMFVGNGMMSMLAFLAQHPLPTVKTVTTVETTEKQPPSTVVVTKVEETVIKPADPLKPKP